MQLELITWGIHIINSGFMYTLSDWIRLESKSWLDSPSQLITCSASSDSLISPAVPQRLLVPVLQMLHEGPGHTAARSGPLSQQILRGYLTNCRFNYATIHSLTQWISQSTVRGLHWLEINRTFPPGNICMNWGLGNDMFFSPKHKADSFIVVSLQPCLNVHDYFSMHVHLLYRADDVSCCVSIQSPLL